MTEHHAVYLFYDSVRDGFAMAIGKDAQRNVYSWENRRERTTLWSSLREALRNMDTEASPDWEFPGGR
jgi:hypothetical protein